MTKDKLFDVSKDIVLITGAVGQLGSEYAKTFLERGSKVVGLDVQSSAESEALALEYPGHYIFCAVDVTNKGALQQSLKKVESTFGTPTVLINNAAIDSPPSAPPEENGPFEDYPEESWDKVMDVNLKGVWISCQAEARAMIAHGKGGSIVNIASMSGVIVNRGLNQAHYNASKAGVIHMSKSMAMEWVDRRIRVNSISPGYTATPMNTRPEMLKQTKKFESQTPMKRMASVDEMVGPAVFLLSDAASFCTGVDLLVDGGFCCW